MRKKILYILILYFTLSCDQEFNFTSKETATLLNNKDDVKISVKFFFTNRIKLPKSGNHESFKLFPRSWVGDDWKSFFYGTNSERSDELSSLREQSQLMNDLVYGYFLVHKIITDLNDTYDEIIRNESLKKRESSLGFVDQYYIEVLKASISHVIPMFYILTEYSALFSEMSEDGKRDIIEFLYEQLHSGNTKIPKTLFIVLSEYLISFIKTTECLFGDWFAPFLSFVQNINTIYLNCIWSCLDQEINIKYYDKKDKKYYFVINKLSSGLINSNKFVRVNNDVRRPKYFNSFRFPDTMKSISSEEMSLKLNLISLNDFWDIDLGLDCEVKKASLYDRCPAALKFTEYKTKERKITTFIDIINSPKYLLSIACEYGFHIRKNLNLEFKKEEEYKLDLCEDLENFFFAGIYLSHKNGRNFNRVQFTKWGFDCCGDLSSGVQSRIIVEKRKKAFAYGVLMRVGNKKIDENEITSLHENFKSLLYSTNFLETFGNQCFDFYSP